MHDGSGRSSRILGPGTRFGSNGLVVRFKARGAHVTVSSTLELPVLAGTRRRASQVLSLLPNDLSGRVVQLRGDLLIAGSASFADEIVHTVLVERGAQLLAVASVSDREFIDALRDRVAAHGVDDRLQVYPAKEVCGAS